MSTGDVSSTGDQLQQSLAGLYTIERELGRGGMATVYLARDIKHSRSVALKVLDPELGAMLGGDRFLSEIRVTASLQHPNLLPLFDSGEAGGLLYYVMPYVDGETLRHRLDREKQLPIDEAIRITTAIASALDYAHARGVIHRDLKPENILLHAGQPVIADFGIALAVSNAGGTRVTQTGLSLGTPQYMSPEQATGDRSIDGRTDVYSLGAVLYEMLAGEPPHTGTSAQAVIAKLMTEDVRPLTVLRRSVPPHVDAAVRQALERLPADRFATAGDFALALSGARPVAMPTHSPMHSATRASARSRVSIAIVGVAAAAVGAGLASLWFVTRPERALMPAMFTLGLPESVTVAGVPDTKVAISRDGTRIVVVGETKNTVALYLRRIGEPVAHRIIGSDIIASARVGPAPTFSPDGDWIMFNSGGALKKIQVTGGTPQTVVDSGYAPNWGEPGTLLYRSGANAVWLASPDGGTTRRRFGPNSAPGVVALLRPWMLPGGGAVLVTLARRVRAPVVDSTPHIGLLSLGDSAIADFGLEGEDARYVRSGQILFRRGGGLFAAPFSLRKMRITGPARQLTDGAEGGQDGVAGYDVSDNGTVVYHGGSAAGRNLVIVGRDGSEQVVPGGLGPFGTPRVSPDGRRAVVGTGLAAPNGDLWLVDLANGARERLTVANGGSRAAWTRDGARVVFIRGGGERGSGIREIVSRAWDRSSPDQVLSTDRTHDPSEIAMGPSHAYSLIRGNDSVSGARGAGRSSGRGQGRASRGDIFIAPTDSLHAMRPFVATPAGEYDPAISADGRFAAYQSDETGTPEIYVQPIPGPGPRIKVSISGGIDPLWSPKGSTLYYRAKSRVVAAELSGTPLAVVKRDSLFLDRYLSSGNAHEWDVMPDGQRFLMSRPPPTTGAAVLVLLNWPQVLATPASTPVMKK